MEAENLTSGINIQKGPSITLCNVCLLGDLSRAKIPKTSELKTRAPLEHVSSDVCEPVEIVPEEEDWYFVMFIHDASKWVAVYPIKAKSDVFKCFKKYLSPSERQIGSKVKLLQSDACEEYINTKLQRFSASKNFSFRRS